MENNLKEIGGYFELELRRGREYYPDAIKLNSARNCLKYILMAQKPSKIHMPYYMQEGMMEKSIREMVELEFYNINERFELSRDISVKEDEKIVYNNYYASKDEYIKKLAKKYVGKLIVDNTHAFYSKPLQGIDTLYSLGSKYFGVPGGGYLFTTKKINKEFEQDYAHAKLNHMLGRVEKPASEFFDAFQESKRGRNNQEIKFMSKMAISILSSIDYESIKIIRERNFYYLHSFLKNINELELDFSSIEGPMVYPLLIINDNLRQTLINNKVYVPMFWKEILETKGANDFEKKISKYLLPLPIDQRYDITDMNAIVKIIHQSVKS